MKRLFLKENPILSIIVGVIVFSLALLAECLFTIDTGLMSFCKGLGIGIIFGGVIGKFNLMRKKRSERK